MKEKQRQRKLGTTIKRKGKGFKQEFIEKYGEEEGKKRYEEFRQKQRQSHIGKIQTQETINKRKQSTGDPWNKGKTYSAKKWSETNKLKLRKPKNTRQKEMIKNPELIKKIKTLRNEGNFYILYQKKLE